ncbi:MAG: hypothetical protein KC940_11525, partial [Candidatus Omnitrophica bacterium]|nr:hypothetical protein [Candidatus Omnitrophota bacterium]
VAVNGSSSATGEYILQNVPAGQYIVRADPSAQQGYVDQYSGGVFLRSEATFVMVPSVGDVTVDFSLSPGALISGQITVAGEGIPAAGVDLDVFTAGGEFISSANAKTDVGGSYEIGAFPPGSYLLRADPIPESFLIGRYYLNGEDRASATPIQITGTNDQTGIDISIPRGGLIQGVVTQQGAGVTLAGQDLDLFTDTGSFVRAGATTSATGFYQIGPVLPGNYRVRVDPEPVTGLVRTFHPSVLFESDGQLVAVSLNTITTGIDIQAPLGGTISGVIREATILTPISGIDLDVFDTIGRRMPVNAASMVDGSYLIGGLPQGDYRIRADPTRAQGFALKYYQDTLIEASATSVSVTVGNETSGIDLDLDPAGTIQGTIVDAVTMAPLAGVDLDLFDSQRKFFSAVDAVTSATGFFILGPVPFGSWFLQADPTPDTGYADQSFQNEYALSRATPIAVNGTAPNATADFSLEPGGFIAGKIQSSTSLAGLSGIDLDAFYPDRRRLDITTKSDLSGNYRLGPLPPGQYLLRADPPLISGLLEEFYDGVADVTSAQLIDVTMGIDTAGIDFLLGPDTSVTPTPTNTQSVTDTPTSTATETPSPTLTATPSPTTTATVTSTPSTTAGIPGDFNHDGGADGIDLLNLLTQIRSGILDPIDPADLNGNSIPESEDLILFTLDWQHTEMP